MDVYRKYEIFWIILNINCSAVSCLVVVTCDRTFLILIVLPFVPLGPLGNLSQVSVGTDADLLKSAN